MYLLYRFVSFVLYCNFLRFCLRYFDVVQKLRKQKKLFSVSFFCLCSQTKTSQTKIE